MAQHICKECGHYRDFGSKGKYCVHIRDDVMAREKACNEFITPELEKHGYVKTKQHRSYLAIDREHRRGDQLHKASGIKAKGMRTKEREDYRSDALKTARTRTYRKD